MALYAVLCEQSRRNSQSIVAERERAALTDYKDPFESYYGPDESKPEPNALRLCAP